MDEPGAEERAVAIAVGDVTLQGDLAVPSAPRGVVLFAHGTGSGRHSARNRRVAGVLQRARLATLLFDLLTEEEEMVDLQSRHLRFDIQLLADRLVAATHWTRTTPETAALPIGYFGASTGGGAALVAAGALPTEVRAVVSRGGRPDLAGGVLPHVEAPTLLIVGGADLPVLEMNREALTRLRCERSLEIVPGASHLFEEPGALDRVAALARDWFERHLTPARPKASERAR